MYAWRGGNAGCGKREFCFYTGKKAIIPGHEICPGMIVSYSGCNNPI